MHNKNYKYVYYDDNFGKCLGYIKHAQIVSEDELFVIIIAEKSMDEKQWDFSNKDSEILLDLRKVNNWKLYDNTEEFFKEFFEALL